MNFTDAVTLAGTRRREDGYLVADARIARTGVQLYSGREVGKPEMAVVRVYRPGSEVFSDETLASFAHRPVTNDHPPEAVTADNWKRFAVGQTGDEITGEKIFIRVPLQISDGATIDAVEAGKRELSAGYTCTLDWTAGETGGGEAYDAVQTNIRANHVAVVARGRAGGECRIGDDADRWGAAPIADAEKGTAMPNDLRKVMVDGLSVETTDAGADAITKLQNDAKTAREKHDTDLAAKDATIAAKDADLAKKDAAIADLEGKILDEAAIDQRVQARAGLVTTAKAIAKDVKTEGLSDAAIRKATVIAKLGDKAVEGKSEAYIDARFDILAEDASKAAPADPLRAAVAGTVQTDADSPSAAWAARNADMQDAWKRPVAANKGVN